MPETVDLRLDIRVADISRRTIKTNSLFQSSMILAKHCLFATILLLLMFPKYSLVAENEKITISARETLSAVELDVGDSLVFIFWTELVSLRLDALNYGIYGSS